MTARNKTGGSGHGRLDHGCNSFVEHGSPLIGCTTNATCREMGHPVGNQPLHKKMLNQKPHPSLDRTMSPTGFLSRLGGEGTGAHILVVFKGRAGHAWKSSDSLELQLSKSARHINNLAKAEFPFTKLFSHRQHLFMMQVAADSKESAPLVNLEQILTCQGKLQRTTIAKMRWPSLVQRRMNFLCEPYANEEETLKTSSPSILHNAHYDTSTLLMTIKNQVFTYDISHHIKASCDLPSGAAPTLESSAPSIVLTGRSTMDPKLSQSNVQSVMSNEMMYTLSSYNVLQSVDMSLAVPCGRVMDAMQERFLSWNVPVNKTEHHPIDQLQLSMAGRNHTAEWSCITSKQVQEFHRAILTKTSACCYLSRNGVNSGGGMPCCVEKKAKGSKHLDEASLGVALGSL